MRLDKFIANSTDYSRKDVKKAIKQQHVWVNGTLATDAGLHVDDSAEVTVNGARISAPKPRYFMLNKPQGYICATKDAKQATVIDLLLDEANTAALHIAGRLDIDTTGLVLITDDGNWTHQLIAPNKHCPKRYLVDTAKPICAKTIKYFERGLMLPNESKRCQPAEVELLAAQQCILTIYEGKYHQVKRMFTAMANEVTALHRLSIGAIELDTALPEGDYRPLSAIEANSVYTNAAAAE